MKDVKIILSDRQKTAFLQHCDVFEKFKVLVKPTFIATVVDDYGEKHINALKKHCEGQPFGLVAVFDNSTIYYRDPTVKSINNGESWVVLDDLLPS